MPSCARRRRRIERYGAECIRFYIISKCASVSDLLEVNVLLKEAGLYRAQPSISAAIMAVPLFETIADLEGSAKVMQAWLELPEAAAVTRPSAFKKSWSVIRTRTRTEAT